MRETKIVENRRFTQYNTKKVMKKKLEAELISIAHRILKLKNKSELVQLHQESQKLYEKLSVLLFVEENFAGLQPTIGKSEAYEVLETAFEDSKE